MDRLPDEVLVHRANLLTEKAHALLAQAWGVRRELRRRQRADPKLKSFLDAKQARSLVYAYVGPIV